MKRNHLFRPVLIAFIIISLTACIGGGGKHEDPTPSCTAQASSEITAFNLFDLNPSSPYFNAAVANFSFTQASQVYTNSCGVDTYGSTSLTITNGVNRTISFSYQVTATIGIVTWQYQNVATIPPNSFINVGVMQFEVVRAGNFWSLGSPVLRTRSTQRAARS